MKAIVLHHLGVPCVCQIKKTSGETVELTTKFFLNPDALIRIEPGGAIILPPQLYSTFLHIDQELLEKIMTSNEISVLDWPKETFDLLFLNQVIIAQKKEGSSPRVLRVGVAGLPNQVLFEVTPACQCDCEQCYHKQDLGGLSPSLSALRQRVDKLKELGVGMFEVTGGEPLLQKCLPEILNYIDGQGLHFYVVTNGEYLCEASPELLSALSRGLGIAVSLDGVDEVHDQVRHRPGLYDKILEGLEIVADYGINVYFISTLSSYNISSIPGMIALASKYKTTIHLRPAINTGSARDNNLSLDLRPFIGDYLSNPSVRNGLLSTKKTIPEAKYYGCGIRKRISVDSYGNLFPCVMDRSRKLSRIMDYNESSLVEELEKETSHFLKNNKKCLECKFVSSGKELICGGACRFSKFYKS